jgi:hypothetical protein
MDYISMKVRSTSGSKYSRSRDFKYSFGISRKDLGDTAIEGVGCAEVFRTRHAAGGDGAPDFPA